WLVARDYHFALTSTAAPSENSHAAASPSAHSYLFSATFDYATGKEVTEDHSAERPQAAQQQQFVIDRIEFIGNRRVRSDTLTARIFSRPGDVFNEETLRRDFHAPWNP